MLRKIIKKAIDTMSRLQELVNELYKLKSEYGGFHFNLALKEIRRRRLEVSKRGKRERFPWSKYRKLYNRQKGVCPLCNETMPFIRGEIEIDHRDPNREDFNSEDNLQLTHKRCNRAKSAKSVSTLSKESGKTIQELLK